jgi:hypothetical protein
VSSLRKPLLFCLAILVLTPGLLLYAQRRRAGGEKVSYISFAEAQPIVVAMAEILPEGLKGKNESEIARLWPGWVQAHDQTIRARLEQGDEDSLVNFLLFGSSFTRQPRISLAQVRLLPVDSLSPNVDATAIAQTRTQINARIDDLLRSLGKAQGNERLLFARRILVTQKGFHIESVAGRDAARKFLLARLEHVVNENVGYTRALETARMQGDPTEEFAERSRLFRARGLASDTSLLPNFALEEALKEIKARGLLSSRGVKRVGIVGPGLDFTDKQEGYDFYPLQTMQPFAVIDTLLRLGLARANDLQVFTFDLSPRVNGHIANTRRRAAAGAAYVIQLPRDPAAGWKAEAIRYWENFGDQIGRPAPAVSVPVDAGELKIRAVRIPPEIVSRVTPVDTNIVLQRAELSPGEKFDLIIGTNIFLYYDNFEQSLAMTNIEHMLRPGGLLLSNNAMLELPFFRIHSVGYSSVLYSDRADDGDTIVWYQRAAD